jgi:hypothetical protein
MIGFRQQTGIGAAELAEAERIHPVVADMMLENGDVGIGQGTQDRMTAAAFGIAFFLIHQRHRLAVEA